ncbi:MAG: efflux RND transporter permease subunit [Planctomycetota bacterium]
MRISEISIKNPVMAWMLMAALLVFGAVSFSRLGISQNPDVDYPNVNVSLTWEGAAPEVMENEVVDVIEETLMTVEGIEGITSNARFGEARVTAEFGLDKNIDVAIQEVQAKIAQAQRNLPKDLLPPQVSKVNPEDEPIMWIAVHGDAPMKEIINLVRNEVKDRFQTIPGVGEVSLGGYVEPAVRVWLDPVKLEQWQLTVDDVVAAIEAQHSEMPAGVLRTVKDERGVRVMGEAATVEEIGSLVIPARVGEGSMWQTVRLSDVARIEDGLSDVRRVSRFNGRPSLGLGIKKQRGSNAVEIGNLVKQRIEEVRKELPQGVSIDLSFDTTRFVAENVHELMFTLVLSVFLTAMVCWLFIGSWSATFNVLLAIPTSIGGAFIMMDLFGFTLNTFTLLALSLVVGVVVDDAIVVLENITRHREGGKSQYRSALDGSREIGFSVLAISAAVIAIFLPVAFMKGVIGKFYYQFGVTTSCAVAFSLLEALTLTPMRCSRFRGEHKPSRIPAMVSGWETGLSRHYGRFLAMALRHPWRVTLSMITLFGASLFILTAIRHEMLPTFDMGVFSSRLQTPPGSSLEYTDSVVKQAEAIVLARPETARMYCAVGGFGGGEVNSANMSITMKPQGERPANPAKGRPLTQQEFMQELRDEFAKIPALRRVSLREISMMQARGASNRGYPIEFRVTGPNWDELGALSLELEKKLETSGFMTDLDSDYLVGVPEVRVLPDREKAARGSVTVSKVARTINAAIGGTKAGKFSRDGRRYDIRVSLEDRVRSSHQDIGRLMVRNQHGELVSLDSVARTVDTPVQLKISRENRARAIRIFGNVAKGHSQAEALDMVRSLASSLPQGYHLELTGGAAQFEDTTREALIALGLGVMIAYMILAAQFNSFIHPFTVLLALPFSITGALVALWITGNSMNMMSLIGLLLLMGLVKKNSILIVDFSNQARARGLPVKEALLEACPLRLRPIMMTSLAIMMGALPAAMALGPGAELRAPMAVTVIGGTMLSTLLSLFVVPCAYLLLSHWERGDASEPGAQE